MRDVCCCRDASVHGSRKRSERELPFRTKQAGPSTTSDESRCSLHDPTRRNRCLGFKMPVPPSRGWRGGGPRGLRGKVASCRLRIPPPNHSLDPGRTPNLSSGGGAAEGAGLKAATISARLHALPMAAGAAAVAGTGGTTRVTRTGDTARATALTETKRDVATGSNAPVVAAPLAAHRISEGPHRATPRRPESSNHDVATPAAVAEMPEKSKAHHEHRQHGSPPESCRRERQPSGRICHARLEAQVTVETRALRGRSFMRPPASDLRPGPPVDLQWKHLGAPRPHFPTSCPPYKRLRCKAKQAQSRPKPPRSWPTPL